MHCIGANYQTQLEQPWQRPDARMQAIRKRLGFYQPRKKGMHRATYKRLFMEYLTIKDSYLDRVKAIDELINTGVIKDTHQLREWKQKARKQGK